MANILTTPIKGTPSFGSPLGRLGKGVGRALGLRDPDNVESELTPLDFKEKSRPEQDEEKEGRIVELVRDRFKRAAEARSYHDRDTLESIAFFHDRQWVEYNPETGKLDSLVTDPADRFYFLTDNQIKPLVLSLLARATAQDPDVWTAPLTESDDDKSAAEESDSILSHCARVLDYKLLKKDWVEQAFIGTTTFLELGWDKSAEAEVPAAIGPDGMPTGAKDAKIGEVYGHLRLGVHVYPDPKTKADFHKAAWVIIADTLPLTDIQQEFGARGKLVEAESFDSQYGGMESRLAQISGDFGRNPGQQKNAATVLRMWERPSVAYPKGRYIISAGTVLLQYQDWPYEKTDKYPLVPLGYQKRTDSVWASNVVSSLIPLQRALNRVISGLTDRVINDKLAILVPDGSDLEPDEYTSPRNYKRINYTPGLQPVFQAPPPPSGFNLEYVSFLKAEMEHIAGSHEVSSASAPPAAFAQGARALELRQMADNSRLSLFVTQLESALVEAAEWQLALYNQYGTAVPRLLGLDQDLMPGKAVAKVMAFRALGKGSCRVVVTPGSGMPKNPAARLEMLDAWFKEGVFGPPGSPAATHTFLELQDEVRSDNLVEKVITRLAAQSQVMQQQAAQQQQMQAQAQQQAAQVAAQTQMQIAQMKIAAEAQAQAASLQIDGQKLQMAQTHEAEMEAVRVHSDAEAAQQTAQIQMQRMMAEKQIPSVSLAGNLGPVGTQSAETAAGLQADTAADAAKVALPPAPMQSGSAQNATKPTGINP